MLYFFKVTFASRVCDHFVFSCFFGVHAGFSAHFGHGDPGRGEAPPWGFFSELVGIQRIFGSFKSSLPPFHLGQATLLKPVEDAEEDA